MSKHTSTCARQLRESKTRVVCWDGLESKVRMPVVVRLLLLPLNLTSIEGLAVFRADGADLVVVSAILPLRVEDRVDVKPRSAGAA